MDYMMGTITLWAASWTPEYWLPCDGRTLPISQYQALYSIIGTVYGGDGKDTFALPDLRGRVPYGWGRNAATSEDFLMGTKFDNKRSFPLAQDQMPAHTHAAIATVTSGGSPTPVTVATTIPAVSDGSNPTNVPADNTVLTKAMTKNGMANLISNIYSTGTPDVHMKGDDISFTLPVPQVGVTVTNAPAGGVKPVVVVPSYQVLNYIICVQGLYPMRS